MAPSAIRCFLVDCLCGPPLRQRICFRQRHARTVFGVRPVGFVRLVTPVRIVESYLSAAHPWPASEGSAAGSLGNLSFRNRALAGAARRANCLNRFLCSPGCGRPPHRPNVTRLQFATHTPLRRVCLGESPRLWAHSSRTSGSASGGLDGDNGLYCSLPS